MGECVHPRSQNYTDDIGRTRCGACGDVWDDRAYNGIGGFVAMPGEVEPRGPLSECCGALIVNQAPGSGDLSTECSNCHAQNPKIKLLVEGMRSWIDPTVIVVDIRNGKVRADGSNIDLPPEGQASFLESLAYADVIVEVHPDTVYVRKGFERHIVLLGQTKSPEQLNAEKSDREKAHRVDDGGEETIGMVGDRATFDDDPVDKKFKRVWDGSVQSGKPVKGGLKGY